jgi:TonB family protein
MRRFLLASIVAVLLLQVSMSMKAVPEEQKENSPKQITAIPAYPESEDGLKNLIGDIFRAMTSGETDMASPYFASLEIPDGLAWFTKAFGPVEGPRLEVKYQALLQQPSGAIRAHFEYALKGGRTNVEVHVLRGTADAKSGMGRAILGTMVQPLPLYSADGTSPTEQYAASIGDFVYVDGGFRFVDPQVFLALSTAPPLRIRVSGDVAVKSLNHKVAPIYPDEARANRVQGTVILHVVIGTNGLVKQIEPVSGDPVLAEAATVAVRQWKYKPTLLNAESVEVDTIVKVDFRL